MRWQYAQLHDYVLFVANTGLRPSETARLEYRDVTIVDDAATGETILEIEVRGKRRRRLLQKHEWCSHTLRASEEAQ